MRFSEEHPEVTFAFHREPAGGKPPAR
jgi:hypothetical protein